MPLQRLGMRMVLISTNHQLFASTIESVQAPHAGPASTALSRSGPRLLCALTHVTCTHTQGADTKCRIEPAVAKIAGNGHTEQDALGPRNPAYVPDMLQPHAINQFGAQDANDCTA
jgi:hypothetical protein